MNTSRSVVFGRSFAGTKSRIRAIGLIILLAWCPGSDAAEQLLPLCDDPQFRRGFTVWSPEPGQHVVEGRIQPWDSTDEPAWGLAQWHSRFTLANRPRETISDRAVHFSDGAKSVTFFPPGADADFAFALNGHVEYGGQAPASGDPWPHLLAERTLVAHPALSELTHLNLALECRLVQAKVHAVPGFDAERHTAQFVFYITVQNRRRESPGYGDYFWFCVPLYDARDRLPRAHKAPDISSDRKQGTGKFIFNPGGARYTQQSVHDGRWISLDQDLLPLIHEGLTTAWEHGFLTDSRAIEDYHLGEMNMGWEVTGPWHVEMQLRGLQLVATLTKSD